MPMITLVLFDCYLLDVALALTYEDINTQLQEEMYAHSGPYLYIIITRILLLLHYIVVLVEPLYKGHLATRDTFLFNKGHLY